MGVNIILHTYAYNDFKKNDMLGTVADEVYYYKRKTGVWSLLSGLPYIVYSRRDKDLVDRLCMDDFPIIFEGLHTCYFLGDKRLEGRVKIVRAHNVEYEYYRLLGENAQSFVKKMYYKLEARKLERYETVLDEASAILAISPDDYRYFKNRYEGVTVSHVPCFSSVSTKDCQMVDCPEERPYILFHGNLGVEENIAVVRYLLDEVLPGLKGGYSVVIAGRNPGARLKNSISECPGVELYENLDSDVMDSLVQNAHVNILLTFQPTGIKLKLINTLKISRGFCIANDFMLNDDNLRCLCIVANTTKELTDAIDDAMGRRMQDSELEYRRRLVDTYYDNDVNAMKISDIIALLQSN